MRQAKRITLFLLLGIVFCAALAIACSLVLQLAPVARAKQRIIFSLALMFYADDNPVSLPVEKVTFLNWGGVDDKLLKAVDTAFQDRFSIQTEITYKAFDRSKGYDEKRDAYLVAILLEELEQVQAPEQERIFAFTNARLFNDYLSDILAKTSKSKRVGVISIGAIKRDNPDYSLTVERTIKTLLRSFGSTLGFGRSADAHCIMSFAFNLSELDKKGFDYCGKQNLYLQRSGMLK